MERGGLYPRVCGGTVTEWDAETGTCALSPRVRGNREDDILKDECHRSIPACAGEP